MALRRTVGLGTLVIRGSKLEFRPSGNLAFEASAGDELHVGLTYNYDDTSPQKNGGKVALTLELNGVTTVVEATIRDLPGIDDRDRRFLGHVVPLPVAGELAGRFQLLAELEESGWTRGAPSTKSTFREEGSFTVTVR